MERAMPKESLPDTPLTVESAVPSTDASPIETLSGTETSSSGKFSDTQTAPSTVTAPVYASLALTRQWARNAIDGWLSADPATGTIWWVAFSERYTCVL